MEWPVQDARQRFSQLVRRAVSEGPQVVTRNGEELVVVVAADEYHRLTGPRPNFKAFLLSPPDLDFDALDLTRRPDGLPRQIEL